MKKALKKVLVAILTLCLLLGLCGCSKEKTSIKDYQYMYDGVFEDWKKRTDHDEDRENLLGFGEYLYNSELILFPRETPTTLKEFYYHWTQYLDVDGYAIYFTCELTESNYESFVEGLNNFVVENGSETTELLYNTEHFSLPTYIVQWSDVGEKWEVLEYIMLDEKNCTAIFVYTMGELDYIEKHSDYTVTPEKSDFLTENFSIYNDLENSDYDISFLEYLL